LFHPVKVLDGQLKNLRVLQGHDCELPLQFVFVHHPGVEVNLRRKDRTDDVDDSKMGAHFDVDESCVLVFWQHETSFAFNKEVNVGDLITLEVDIIVGWVALGLQ